MADPAGLTTLAIGSRAPDFKLPGVDGKMYSLQDFAGSKVLVVVFTCNHCPTAQAYEGRIARLHAETKGKGVAVVAISPNDPAALRLDELGYTDLSDSFEEMKVRAKDHHFAYPYLYDGETQATSRAYGVLATPQVYVFDESRTLRYVGRFDDAESEAKVKSRDAVNAVGALLAGKAVPVAKTRVFGCSTKWSDKRADAARSLAKWDAEPVDLGPIDVAGAAKLAGNETDRLTLVNLWASWCGPCVAELPELVEINRMYRGRPFRLVTISLDEPAKKGEALRILKENHASATNYLMSAADRDAFGDALDKQWPGPVPYTLLIAPGGKIVYRKAGAIDPLELKRAIVDQLGRTYR
jgi:peroxiredoxin